MDQIGLAHSKDGTVRSWMPTRRTMGYRSRLPLRSWRLTDRERRRCSGDRGGDLARKAFPLALDHAMWHKSKIGQSLGIVDPETNAPAMKNPFLQPKPGVLAVDDMAIDRLLANGALFGACAVALKMLSGKLAHNADMSAEETAK